jgi:hypothetical protein
MVNRDWPSHAESDQIHGCLFLIRQDQFCSQPTTHYASGYAAPVLMTSNPLIVLSTAMASSDTPKITLLWLEKSRAQRILWLLEELGVPYIRKNPTVYIVRCSSRSHRSAVDNPLLYSSCSCALQLCSST